MEIESDWISLIEDLRIDLESNRQRAEKVEMELRFEKKCTEELDDVLKRSVLGHARMFEHNTELQKKYNDLVGKNRSIMEGIAEVKRAAAIAGAKGHGSCFSKSLAAELLGLRVERERELLKKENMSLRIQLRDTAEAVHAAGELLVRLREAEQSASVAERALLYESMETSKLGAEDLRTVMKLDPGNRLARSAIRYHAFIVHPKKAEDLRGWTSRTFFSYNRSTTIEIALKMAFRKFVFDHGIVWDHLKFNTAQSCIELKANKKTRNRAYDILVQIGHACVAMLLLCCFALLH